MTTSAWIKLFLPQLEQHVMLHKSFLHKFVIANHTNARTNIHKATISINRESFDVIARILLSTSIFLRDVLGQDEQNKYLFCFSDIQFAAPGAHSRIDPNTFFHACKEAAYHLEHLYHFILNHPDHIVFNEPAISNVIKYTTPEQNAEIPNGVFIVHGHGELERLELESILRKELNIPCCTLSTEPNSGMTIIEKFEFYASRCSFAIGVFTPDDRVIKQNDEYSQARPNALFEFGWFCGRLGRHRTCIIANSTTEIPTDLNGIARIIFPNKIGDRFLEIKKELTTAGLCL